MDEATALAVLREQTEAALDGRLLVGVADLVPEHPPLDDAVRDPPTPTFADLDRVVEVLSDRYRLTWREREVLEQVLLGRSNIAVARVLGVKLRTAKTHVERVWEKLGVRSRAKLMGRLFVEGP